VLTALGYRAHWSARTLAFVALWGWLTAAIAAFGAHEAHVRAEEVERLHRETLRRGAVAGANGGLAAAGASRGGVRAVQTTASRVSGANRQIADENVELGKNSGHPNGARRRHPSSAGPLPFVFPPNPFAAEEAE
jgi:hypothetical protein